MKKLLAIAILFLMLTVTVSAQKGAKQRQKIESLRVAFITQKLDLSPEEAQRFWPVYNKYRKEHRQLKMFYNLPKSTTGLSDQQAEDLIAASLELEEEEIKLKRACYKEMREVLPVQKVALLKKTEREFKENLINKLDERRKQRRQRHKGMN